MQPIEQLVSGEQKVVLAAATLPGLPPAEAGDTTSEYGLVKIFGLVTATLYTLMVGAVAAHLIAMSSETLAFVGTAVTAVNGVVVSVYAVARSSRKRGTPPGRVG